MKNISRDTCIAWVHSTTEDLATVLARTSCLGNKGQALVRGVQECNLNRVSNSTPSLCLAVCWRQASQQDRTGCRKLQSRCDQAPEIASKPQLFLLKLRYVGSDSTVMTHAVYSEDYLHYTYVTIHRLNVIWNLYEMCVCQLSGLHIQMCAISFSQITTNVKSALCVILQFFLLSLIVHNADSTFTIDQKWISALPYWLF